jgi:hypothetical protein
MPAGPRPGSPAQRGNRPARHAAARERRTRDGVVACSPAVARRRQGVAGDLEGVTGKVPGKEERAGAHRNGGSTVRRCKRRRAAVFAGGEGASVVVGGGDEVLHLGRAEGVRDLQEISGIDSSGRSSPGSGGRRWCSAGIRAGEGAVGGRRRRSGCGEQWGSSSAREEGVEEEWRWENEWSSASGERAARRQRDRWERGGKKRGPRTGGVPWGLAPISGRRPAAARARRSRATCAARARAGRTKRGEAPDGWAAAQCQAAVSLTGGAGLSAGVRGPAREESGVAEPDEQ